MINVGVAGAAGKMGKTLIQAIAEADEFRLTAAIERAGSSVLGRDSGELAGLGRNGVKITDNVESACDSFAILIDFTIAKATAGNINICLANNRKMVIGTTGLTESEIDEMVSASRKIAIVHASNYSVGVNASFKLAETAAAVLGDDVDIEIIEAHHRHKVDAPSGTALTLGEVVASQLGRKLEDVAIYGRQGLAQTRPRHAIAFHSLRAGDIVGDHTVAFVGHGERLEITHRAQSRMNFAQGALRAAKYVTNQSKGLFSMQDVLGFNKIKV